MALGLWLARRQQQLQEGIGLRDVSGTRHGDNQAIGAQVCKFGVTTGRTCGNIETKSYTPSYVTSAASTFVRMDGGSSISALPAGPGT